MDIARVSTGVAGLDDILCGGLIPASSYLLVGGPGSGKTVLSLQFLRQSAGQGARCLLITFGEPEETIRRNAAQFGWDLDGIAVVDLSKAGEASLPEGEYSVFAPSEVETEPVWKLMHEAIERHTPERLVIDSATYLSYLSTNEYQYRKQVQSLLNGLCARGCVSLLLYEPSELQKDNALALAVDGILTLRKEISAGRVVEIRTLEVDKLRGSGFLSGRHPFRITGQGLTVWPHRIERSERAPYDQATLRSNVAGLDELTGGGIRAGTCTLISGPAGAGKSTLAIQYMTTAAAEGRKGVIYTFEEGVSSMLERCRALSIPLEPRIQDGTIVVREINPLDHYPDEFLDVLRRDLAEGGARVFALDSLRGYKLAMDEFGSVIAGIQNLIAYVRGHRANLFVVNEQEKITGDLQITDLGVSYVADNVLLIRYAEVDGRVIRVIHCIKKRLGEHQHDLREFSVTSNGLVVGDRISRMRGVLTGVPTVDTTRERIGPAEGRSRGE